MARYGLFVVMAGRAAGGPETYEHGLLRSLAELDRGNDYHVYCFSPEAASSFRTDAENITFHILGGGPRIVRTLTTLPLGVFRDRIDLLHATLVPPLVSPSGYVFTMHCFSTFNHPEFYRPEHARQLNRLMMRAMKKARLLLCVSQNVRDLIAEEFKVPDDRLAVVYNGISDAFHPGDRERARVRVAERYGLVRPYLLFAGQLKTRKNILRILEAFARVRANGYEELSLVLAGRRDWSSDDLDRAMERLAIRPHVIELGHLENEDLPDLYRAAETFVFPSLWEGFGIPVIEAMACGTPVITSNLSSLPEVAGGQALLVDPYSVDAIADAVERALSDTELRERLIAGGIDRAREFSWRRTAEHTLSAYERAVGR